MSPRRVVLAGDLGAPEIESLTTYCARLHSTGQSTLLLDLSGVTSCDRTALERLTALTADGSGLTVTVTGARWGQFIAMLGASDVLEVRHVHASVRTFLHRP